MVLPDKPYYPYYQILDRQMDFQTWWTLYAKYQVDYIQKGDTDFFSYLLESAPHRWYSRIVLNLYTPVARDTVKFFLPLSLDYESVLLGSAAGMLIYIRHYLEYRSSKTSKLGPGEGFCTGRNTHYSRKWEQTRINPRKFHEYDRKMRRRKLMTGALQGLLYGVIGSFFVHGFSSTSFFWVDRHFPVFIGTTWVTYSLNLYDRDYLDMNYNFYKHPELYVLGMLLLYNVCKHFRNYVCNVPAKRVLIG